MVGQRQYLQFELELRHHGQQDGGVDGMQLKNEVVDMLRDLALSTAPHHQSIVEELGRDAYRRVYTCTCTCILYEL